MSLDSPSLPCPARSRVISVPDTVEGTVVAVGMAVIVIEVAVVTAEVAVVMAEVAVNFRRARTLARKPGSRRSPRGERRRDTVAFLFPT
ncbi:hypothetical protein NX794_24255 [Streptomyces sp. LP11]|uniref:Uncharacterized protein n=1 Tax=Streptomyces pyxinicus TaxID=2970331 RepID=A0ABT2B714_9ACTN|nr:hypothetical protein [Streptomyces sp. LP11]MCS0604304.1 hypothetical protein [Streptomyces sp. LP11]